MKKISAILLTSIFAFSQYARQLSWLECKFSNSFKTVSSKCDCEKQAGLYTQNDDQLPISKTHTHIHPDEFFTAMREIVIDPYFKMAALHLNGLHRGDACKGNYPRPWQPPNI